MLKIKMILKRVRLVYWIYNYVLSFLLRILSLFIKTDEKLVLFNSYGGQKFDDSPKIIYEYMKNNIRYESYKLIWAINDSYVLNEGVTFVKNGSLNFFITALKAKYWITNSSIERGLKFKKNNTIYIYTMHGSPILKCIGKDLKSTTTKFRVSKPDYYFAQSDLDAEVFANAYNVDIKKMLVVGLPRNDELIHVNKTEVDSIKHKLNIPLNKKVIMYAPTFREYNYTINGNVLLPPINIDKWQNKLSDNYVLLFRAHYEINKTLNITNNGFTYNVSNYPNLNDLLKITDILVTDYSSIMLDFSILGRPIYIFAFDYNDYLEKRGMYINLKDELTNNFCVNENELIQKIINCDFEKENEITNSFKNKYVTKFGDSAKYIEELIPQK